MVGGGAAEPGRAVDPSGRDGPVARAADPVDAVATGVPGVEAGEGSLGAGRAGFGHRHAERVDERRGGLSVGREERLVGGRAFTGVEVAGDDDPAALAELRDPTAEQRRRLAPRLCTLVVEVGVDEEQRLRRRVGLVGELHPGGDPRQRRVPALAADHVGRGGEPEVAPGELLEAVGAPQQRRHLPLLLPIVAADAGGLVAVEEAEELVALEGERLLRAEEMGIELRHRVGEELLPFRPGVLAVVGGAVADVVAHHPDRLGGERRPCPAEHHHANHRHRPCRSNHAHRSLPLTSSGRATAAW